MAQTRVQQAVDKLVIAISSRALFDLNDSHVIYEEQGLEAYQQYQIEHENEPLQPGGAFNLVKKLLHLNTLLDTQRVEVILLSRNSADTGLRVFNSIEHYGLPIIRAAFSGGMSPYRYISPFNCHLFLSMDGADVRQALEQGVAAATILPSAPQAASDTQVKFAFDGDAVLFSDEAERIYKSQGLEAFAKSEKKSANQPLSGGPFKPFLAALQQLQMQFPPGLSPIRTCLVTARSAPAHERVVKTLRAWNIRIDESLFLGGMAKGVFLKAFDADVFFDDQEAHCDSAREHVATGHVPHGVANENISQLTADKKD
ncbi:MAG TPA: 5'-nucleotidase [Pseudohongiella sp.]|nr:5'-nucleotidase [Pseudohongiella sp.]HBX37615.1 5'-nucleotidase [Pseudohongiella sp.]|tara:strand:- start:380 stop:1321 length:942 start_codon:yes stop_codon:yes gene_type:complete